MENLFIYLLKVLLCSGVMYLYYQLSLKDKTFHHYNRFYLLAAMLISLFLPLLKVQDFTIEVSDRIYLLFEQMQSFKTPKNNNNDHIYFRIIFSALGLVSLFFIIKILAGIFKIEKLKSSFRKEQIKGINFYQTDLTDAPFSYFRNLFWKDSITLDSDVGKQILKHEMVHIEQKHSIDKIFAEVITAMFWFNPFFYLIKKEISLIHEYLADNKAVEKKDTKAFAQMLLASHFSGTALPAASPFLNSNLKKRLQMLQKPNTKFGYARRIMALPIVFTVAFAYLVNAENKQIKQSNIEIEKAVSEITKDTIVPENKIVINEKIAPPRLRKEVKAKEELKVLSSKIEKESEKLKEFKPDSEEFKASLKEIEKLSREISKTVNSNEFSLHIPNMDSEKMMKLFNSEGWKNELERLKTMNIEMPDLSKIEIDGEKLSFPEGTNVKIYRHNGNTIDFPKGSKVKMYKNGENIDTSWMPGSEAFIEKKESPENAKRRAKLEKEAAKLNAKRAKLEGERAKIEAERRMLDGRNPMVIRSSRVMEAPFPPINGRVRAMSFPNESISVSKDKSLSISGTSDVKFYLNNKEITELEFKKLDPQTIKSINVTKNNTDGKSSGKIYVETK
ncbi:antirepressor [Chryseobacterium sp. Leaf404]|uniref:M56 family metallopeptidase n=1 Tax=unclassified Chryseobacterium TaxID=2593645 RepID=UPI0006FF5179|nr:MULTISPECIES: M56 family metallopeptidase [unclassified Chryseobacterium]KQT17474.1 antirepressor [Chryseobacterium sp. Leaf404]